MRFARRARKGPDCEGYCAGDVAGLLLRVGLASLALQLRPTALLLQARPLLSFGHLHGDPGFLGTGPLLERRAQPGERYLPVSVLASRFARGDGNAGRQVSQAHARLGLVLMLPSGTAGAERLDPALREEQVVVGGWVEAVRLAGTVRLVWIVAHGRTIAARTPRSEAGWYSGEPNPAFRRPANPYRD